MAELGVSLGEEKIRKRNKRHKEGTADGEREVDAAGEWRYQ